MAENNKSMDKGRKLLIGFIIVLLLLTAGAYFFGVYYFTEHFLPGSQVNGFNCSYMTEKEAENLLEQKTGVYDWQYRPEETDRKQSQRMKFN